MKQTQQAALPLTHGKGGVVFRRPEILQELHRSPITSIPAGTCALLENPVAVVAKTTAHLLRLFPSLIAH